MEKPDNLLEIPFGDRTVTGYYEDEDQKKFITTTIITPNQDGDIITRVGECITYNSLRAGIMPIDGETKIGVIKRLITPIENHHLPCLVEIEGLPSPLRLYFFVSSQKNHQPEPA
ncbi:MAG: hypothetical protein UV57_C0005G0013 [Parcubacteria group bacterium GW2011_GWD2_43_10]|uniref:Uncharacterized protein n=5 Tax=Candidatus Vebleniibacteriota TaxID=1817921 RepID=A0A1G2Q6B5_9BACT|nr:MAG: hypothetical protein UV47_C0017G0014 [Parcubacteria group bacterium GW2011_GWA2_42_80]KKS79309.1 MAG: hypothetical protein UV52_C0012G0014 [Parcubacteria group bacterium GW2011_GWD1_42_9]KKS83858.1 MAG: hypothetical protein UV57_C0005G0013 [Parcubacteria group bacterium GW2011_GWD2_43_10]KKS92999.1 MAG: hypothetical protein UV69_C0016G0003 [Parcubacteria group bacterium GW2011_GWE2_43_12]KKT13314.1 MAG: hypothetical protein UV92_C0016G0014 [Parcubacteria group bacterium GW2011_GWA1_43_2